MKQLATCRSAAVRAGLIMLAVCALFASLPSSAFAQPTAPTAPPARLSDLSPEQKSWRDPQGVIWCSDHADFANCASNSTGGFRYSEDNTPFVALTNHNNGDGAAQRSVDLNPGHAVSNAVGKAVDSAFGKAAESVGKFAGDMLVESMTWWIGTDSIDLSYADVMSGKQPVQRIVFFIMMAGILSCSILMMITRRTQPAAEVLMGGVKYAVISSMAMIVLSGALHAGDDFAKQMIESGADEFGKRVQLMLGTSTIGNPGGVLFLGSLAALLGFVQWVMGFIRQAGIIVLYSMILFAAAGQLTTWGRQWFPRIASVCIALVLYKPMAAFIYSLGFKLIGTEQSLTTLVTGIMVVALAVIALPAMLKFFDFLGVHVSSGSGALATVMGGAAAGGMFAAAGSGGSGSSSSMSGDGFANFMSATGPGGSGEQDPSPGNTGGQPALGSGSGQQALGSGGGQAAIGSSPKAIGPGGGSGGGAAGSDVEAGPAGQPSEHPDAAGGTPSTPSNVGSAGVDVGPASGNGAAAASGGTSAAGAGGASGAAAGGAAAGAATGGASLAIQAGMDAASSAADAAEGAAEDMSGGGDDTGPAMK